MQMLYNSDSYVVVQFEIPAAAANDAGPLPARGGYEIVDKFARKGIFLEGALADRFQRGVQALVEQHPQDAQAEALDDYIAGFTVLAQQALVLH
jgi:hypothetical protein